MRRHILFLLFCLALPSLAADDWRTFTAADGRKLVAKVLSVDADFVVLELKSNGSQVPVDFERLSEEDVTFLKNFKNASKGAKTASSRERDNPAADEDAGGDDALPEGEPGNNRLYPRTKDEIRSGIREIEGRRKPEGISKQVHEATTLLNIYRFLCGVPHDVEASPDFCQKAEQAALACKRARQLSHTIGSFTNRCNLSTVGNVVASVSQYIEDGGANNRDVRGHRAWCLNPPMGKVGFGSGGDSYSAMWCMDGSGKPIRGTWTYPGKGLFPQEYMHGNAWTLFGAGKPGSLDKLKVEVFRLSTRPDRPFSAHEEIPGRPIKINHVSIGMNAINFEPAEPNKRGVYWVRVNGGEIREGYLVELY